MKFNTKRTLWVGFGFMSICAFWQVYDGIVPLILRNTFGIDGAMDSLKHLKNAGLLITGFGKNYADSRKDLVIERSGEKIGFMRWVDTDYIDPKEQ